MKKHIMCCRGCGKEFEINHEPDYFEEIKCPYCGYINSSIIKWKETKTRIKYWGYL